MLKKKYTMIILILFSYIRRSHSFRIFLALVTFLVLAAMADIVSYTLAEAGNDIRVTGLRVDSLQGDKVCREYFRRIRESGATVDVADCPDLAPVLMAFAVMCGGAKLTGTRRLRFKESDRGAVMAEELAKFGVKVTQEENEIVVGGEPPRTPAEILQGHNDHRIVMALAVLCTHTGGTIEGAEAVNKSFPAFWEAFCAFGARAVVSY